MNGLDMPFIPAGAPAGVLPLARYLPPLPGGMISTWLAQRAPPGSWILDPFGSSPALALEAARAGWRVLVASNNPILRLMTEVLANAPQESDIQAALAELAAARRGDERLEVYLQALYETECAACGEKIAAQAFIWRKDEPQPLARLYRCPHCGDEGDHPPGKGDLERLSAIGNVALHRSRALQRISLDSAEIKAAAEEALNAYLPRPLDFLFTILNKIEGLPLSHERKQLLLALTLSACDEGNALWPWPNPRSRPRQISIPPQFRELNLWQALEQAVTAWSLKAPPVAVKYWPDLPPESGGICIYAGRLKTLLPELPASIKFQAAVAVFPRPNQAFWTLSALWSGWFWGREAILPLKGALERRRYDWGWHANALYNVLQSLSQNSAPGLPFFGLLTELNPGFLAAVITAAEAAGLRLAGQALRAEDELAQVEWLAGQKQVSGPPQPEEAVFSNAILAHLAERNEPAAHLPLFAAGLAALAETGSLGPTGIGTPAARLAKIQAISSQVFSAPGSLKRCGESGQSSESGLWLPAHPLETSQLPLADRIEREVIRYLQKNPGCLLAALDQALCAQFPGLFTPPRELVEACLESYATPVSAAPGHWSLKPQENPAERRAGLQAVRQTLLQLGERLGLAVTDGEPLTWQSGEGAPLYSFYLLASGIISRFVLPPASLSPGRHVIVLPGSRAQLLAFKLERDPRLAETTSAGWRFLKFRHLYRLAERPDLTLALWSELLDKDPPVIKEATQLDIFGGVG